ncbi:hypothetical protein ACFV4K_01180 [Nocardia sp. NPDC059764]|uniref:DUF7373 family lipoprotein n=1 Tax=Nocardia sp. NPDC059764 TaxID=3346939 RepID=UPI00365B60C5
MRAAAAAALAISVLVSAGCGSESHSAEQQTVDLTKLDTGSYATKPQQFEPKDAALAARTTEALRLGNVVPLPMDIDPALTHRMLGVQPFTGVDSFEGDPFLQVLDNEHFTANTPGLVAGFATSAKSDADNNIAFSLREAVMIFDTADSATSAASALARGGFARTESPELAQPASSPQYPSASVTWVPNYQLLASFYATGRFVIVTVAQNTENMQLKVSDQPGLLNLSDKATSATVERLKNFQPTSTDKLAALPLDPQGILRLTLRRPTGDPMAYSFDGVLDNKGALHSSADPSKTAPRYDHTGVDYVGYGVGQMVRTRDTEAAKRYIQEIPVSRFEHRIDPPPGLPSASCYKAKAPNATQFSFHCYVTFDRYAVAVPAAQQQDVYQRTSAQYAILANNK